MNAKKNQRLKLARIFAGLSQDQLGLKVGIDQSRISRIEKGFCKGTDWERTALARALDMNEKFLFDED